MKLGNEDEIIEKLNRKDAWLWFVDHSDRRLVNMACMKNDKIKQAREQLEKIKADKELMERIRLQELAEWDYNTGMANARREGEIAGKIETAKKMLEKNIDIEIIMELTGLSREKIEKLKCPPGTEQSGQDFR